MEPSIRRVVFEYKGLELVILSKPFNSKKLAEKALLEYPDRVVSLRPLARPINAPL